MQPLEINLDQITLTAQNLDKCFKQIFDPINEHAAMSIRLIKQIGSGGYGNVFYMRFKSSNKAYAMKAINRNAINTFLRLVPKTGFPKDDVKEAEMKEEVDYESFIKSLAIEKKLGFLGKECRFLVKLINTCISKVNYKLI